MPEKLLIENQDAGGDSFEVQYNPERYSIERTTNWEERGKRATLQFGGKGRKSITFELFFDTYEEKKDVRTEYVQKLLAFMEATVESSGGRKRPPVLLLTWGGFNFQGVLEKLGQNYTMFGENGVPVRAIVTASFKQFTTAEEETRGNPPGDPTKTHRVIEGETLNHISSKHYGDPTLWRIIAEENRLQDPRRIDEGTLLVIPPLL